MLAWQKFGNGQTPETTGLKGDKLVGNFYVEFDKAYKSEINELIAQGKTEEEAKKQAPLMLEAQQHHFFSFILPMLNSCFNFRMQVSTNFINFI